MTHKGEEDDGHHIFELLCKRDCEATLTRDDDADQEGTKDCVNLYTRL